MRILILILFSFLPVAVHGGEMFEGKPRHLEIEAEEAERFAKFYRTEYERIEVNRQLEEYFEKGGIPFKRSRFAMYLDRKTNRVHSRILIGFVGRFEVVAVNVEEPKVVASGFRGEDFLYFENFSAFLKHHREKRGQKEKGKTGKSEL